MIDWLVDRLVNWSICRLIDWMIDWLGGWLCNMYCVGLERVYHLSGCFHSVCQTVSLMLTQSWPPGLHETSVVVFWKHNMDGKLKLGHWMSWCCCYTGFCYMLHYFSTVLNTLKGTHYHHNRHSNRGDSYQDNTLFLAHPERGLTRRCSRRSLQSTQVIQTEHFRVIQIGTRGCYVSPSTVCGGQAERSVHPQR